MPQRLLLLTGTFEAGLLTPHLTRSNRGCSVRVIDTLKTLESAIVEAPESTRLLAFCTAVIVPRRLLERLSGPSYNVHPGPPTFPGRHPECWGAYEGLPRFGATLHEMVPRVDEGPIVDVVWFDLPAGAGQIEFGLGAFRAAVQLVARWADALAGTDDPLPRSDHRWSGRKTTHRDFEDMCRVGPEIDAAGFHRRRRAFAEQPGSRMTVTLHGCEFYYSAPMQPHPAIDLITV
jgi:methionyl-tRNA formyltransferase